MTPLLAFKRPTVLLPASTVPLTKVVELALVPFSLKVPMLTVPVKTNAPPLLVELLLVELVNVAAVTFPVKMVVPVPMAVKVPTALTFRRSPTRYRSCCQTSRRRMSR